MNKVCFILRSVSGAGKSTFASCIESLYNFAVFEEYGTGKSKKAVVCTADDFFTDEKGNYNWDSARTFLAHKVCKEKFSKAVKENVELVIVANTATTHKEFSFYETEAKNAGYHVFFVILENRHGGRDCHNVPQEAKDRQEENLRKNLKFQ